MNLQLIAAFIKESGLRKVGSLTYMFTALVFLRYRDALPASDFVTLAMVLMGGLVGGNAFEHHADSKKEKKNAPPAPAA